MPGRLVALDWVERQASMLRRDLNLGELDILDPYELAKGLGFIQVMWLTDFRNISPNCFQQLYERDSKGWSAGSLELSGGAVAVIMNPKHSKTRARATLMEEIAHIHLAHQPSLLSVDANSITVRSFNDQQEQEAYWVGAAALVPLEQLRLAQKQGLNIQRLANYCEVSTQLVKFRADVTGVTLI